MLSSCEVSINFIPEVSIAFFITLNSPLKISHDEQNLFPVPEAYKMEQSQNKSPRNHK